MGLAIVVWNGDHVVFVEDLDFPFYDYVVVIDLPGVWFPFKEEFCIDFADTWLGTSWPCLPRFIIDFVIFKTDAWRAW